jgi:hypothetical protein
MFDTAMADSINWLKRTRTSISTTLTRRGGRQIAEASTQGATSQDVSMFSMKDDEATPNACLIITLEAFSQLVVRGDWVFERVAFTSSFT